MIRLDDEARDARDASKALALNPDPGGKLSPAASLKTRGQLPIEGRKTKEGIDGMSLTAPDKFMNPERLTEIRRHRREAEESAGSEDIRETPEGGTGEDGEEDRH